MNRYTLRVKMKDGSFVQVTKVNDASIDELIKVIQTLSAEDKDFKFSDDEKQLVVKAKDISSVEVVL